MNLMKNFLGLMILLLGSKVYAQEITISAPTKLSSKITDYEILGKNQNGIVVHLFNNTNHEVELYNHQLRSVIKKEINLRDKNTRLESIFLREKGGVVFYSQGVGDKQFLKVRYLTDYLETSTTSVVLDSMNKRSLSFNPYYIKQSPNLRYFVFFTIFEDKSKMMVDYKILNENLDLVDQGLFENLQKDVVLKSFKISNQGVVYAVMARQTKSALAGDYIYDEIYTFLYDPNSKNGVQQTSKSQNFRFKNIITEINPHSGKAYTVANYRNHDNTDDIGMSILISDIEKNSGVQLKYNYDRDEMSKLHSYDAKDWKDQAMIIRPKRIISQSDGGCLVISEGQYQYTKVVRTQPSGFYMYGETFTRTYDQNHYFDISAVSVSETGKINWEVNMPKIQITESDGGYFSSFVMFEANNLLKFLFNEDVYSNGNFVEYNLNPVGATKRNIVFNSEKNDLILIPQKALQISESEMLIPSEQKRNLQLVLFKY